MSTTNGTTATNGTKNSNVKTTVPVITPNNSEPVKTEVAKIEASKSSPIQERISRFYELEKLKERRDTIEEALNDLNDFSISPTGGANLKLTDGKNHNFVIAHPIVIGEMVALAKTKLQQELSDIDAKFLL